MYNINVTRVEAFSFPDKQQNTISAVRRKDNACLLLLSENKCTIRQISKRGEIISLPIHDFDANSENLISELVHLNLIDLVFFATSRNLYFCNFNNDNVRKIEIPIPIEEDKAIAAAWNNAQDSLALAFKSGRVQLFCMDFPSFQLKFMVGDNPDKKADENVYLGWGDVKKQFKGKGSASYLNDFHPPSSTYKDSSEAASISWQFGDRFFSVNCKIDNERIIRVYDHCVKLYSTLNQQKVPGICAKTVYRAKHNTLATICKGGTNDSEYYVVLHERNGGFHSKITPINNLKVENIAFSNCGRYFAMMASFQNSYCLDIYIQTNFQWIHKFRFRVANEELIKFEFVKSSDSDLIWLDFIFSNGQAVYGLMQTLSIRNSSAFVQNASTLYEYNYKQAVLPPCGSVCETLQLDETINYIVVHKSKRILALIDATETISVYKSSTHNVHAWQMFKQFNLRSERSHTFLPITWFQFLLTTDISGADILVAIGFHPHDATKSIKKTIDIETENISESHEEEEVAFLHSIINQNGYNIIKRHEMRYLIKNAFCLQLDNGNEATNVVLTTSGQLLFSNKADNEIRKFTQFSSMLNFRDTYLLLSMITPEDPMDRLLCIDFRKLLEYKEELLSGNFDALWSRRIEKSATIISHGKDDGEIVLEMPRGNIELISVRPIILREIAEKIHHGLFHEAYHIVRRHSMKLDLLYDLAPKMFMKNVDKFVESLGQTESVIKFLLPLRNVSTLTLKDYSYITETAICSNAKREEICDAIIKSYKDNCNPDSISYYRVICIALLVKHNRNTLQPLKFLVDHYKGRYTSENLRKLADAIHLLKHYGDVNEMYKQAVGLYDIELASTIAQVSGMDPQINRRFLETCLKSDPITRRFLMANEAGNFHTAALYMLILHRNQLRSLNEFVEYVQANDCMEHVYGAMNKFDKDAFVTITNQLVDAFLKKFMYKSAAGVLSKAAFPRKALECLIKGNCSNEGIVLIETTDEFSNEEKISCFVQLAESCRLHRKFTDAAKIYLKHCNDTAKALDCYLEAGLFVEFVDAFRKLENSTVDAKLYGEKLQESLKDNLRSAEVSIEDLQKKFETYFIRLRNVRQQKQIAEDNRDADDAYSEAGSETTQSYTSASTMTRRTRKLEVKLRSLRHGGKFEDVALMRELFEIACSVFRLAKEMKQFYDIFIEYGSLDPEQASKKLAQLQVYIKDAAKVIWPAHFLTDDDDTLRSDRCTENIPYLSREHRAKPSVLDDPDNYIATIEENSMNSDFV